MELGGGAGGRGEKGDLVISFPLGLSLFLPVESSNDIRLRNLTKKMENASIGKTGQQFQHYISAD